MNLNKMRAAVALNGMIFGMVEQVLGRDSQHPLDTKSKVAICNQAKQLYEKSGENVEAVQMYVASQIPFQDSFEHAFEDSFEDSFEDLFKGADVCSTVSEGHTFFGTSQRKKKAANARRK